MFNELLEHMNTMTLLQDQKYEHFLSRTNMHVQLVKDNAATLVKRYAELVQLLVQVELHDASKYIEPELSPYIELSWYKKLKEKPPECLNDNINKATLHHIKNNLHHPEYHNKDKANINTTNRDDSIECIDASNMDYISIAEMVCDWVAMGTEIGNSARSWYNKTKDKRWKFTSRQEDFIDSILRVFEQSNSDTSFNILVM